MRERGLDVLITDKPETVPPATPANPPTNFADDGYISGRFDDPDEVPCDHCVSKGREWTPDCEANK